MKIVAIVVGGLLFIGSWIGSYFWMVQNLFLSFATAVCFWMMGIALFFFAVVLYIPLSNAYRKLKYGTIWRRDDGRS